MKQPKWGYMEKQPEISHRMRSVLVDWLSSVSDEYGLQPQTLHLAVRYLDTFLSRMSVVRHKFQLVGAAAMLIAAKFEEIYPPEAKEFVYLTADTYSLRQLHKMEQLILRVLQFDLAQPTSFAFIAHLAVATSLRAKTALLAAYASELALLEGNDYLQHPPSRVASAAIVLAQYMIGDDDAWSEQLHFATGFTRQQLAPLALRLNRTVIEQQGSTTMHAIPDKFRTVRYGRVALIKARELSIQEFIEERH